MPGNPVTDPTWATDVADSIERLVGTVRDNVTNRVILVVRGVIFGIIIAMAAVSIVVLVLIAFTRLLQDLLELVVGSHERAVWLSYLLMSAFLFLGGWICMRLRFTKEEVVPA